MNRNAACQLKVVTRKAITGMPSTLDALAQPSKIAVAVPRSCRGNHCPIAFQPAGMVGASPTPSTSRDASSRPSPPAAAEANDATAHSAAATRFTQRTPIRSTIEPIGSCSIA